MLQRLLLWLFPQLKPYVESKLVLFSNALFAIREKLDSLEPKPLRMPVYVTLRGYMIVDGEPILHGWTQRVTPTPGQDWQVPFDPYQPFKCERVDILGPAIITGVNVGNMAQTQSKFQNPATVEFKATCDVGCRVVVHLEGTD